MRILHAGAVSALFACAAASRGDVSYSYRSCVIACTHECRVGSRVEWDAERPLHLRLLGWDCTENCKYECTHADTNKRIRDGMEIVRSGRAAGVG